MLPLWISLLCAATVIIADQIDCAGLNGIKPQCASPEAGHKRDVFWLGAGQYASSEFGAISYDQVYVEKLTPLEGATQPFPLVFFHGGGISGAVSFSN
jgi:hypothetical protein